MTVSPQNPEFNLEVRVTAASLMALCFVVQYAVPRRGSELFTATAVCLSGARWRRRRWRRRNPPPTAVFNWSLYMRVQNASLDSDGHFVVLGAGGGEGVPLP